METKHQRPEGRLIEAARKRHTPALSVRKAATAAGISDGRWRQIANGYQSVGAGQVAIVEGPPETLARMALAVGVTPEELRSVGRIDAADALVMLTDITTATSGREGTLRRLITIRDELNSVIGELRRDGEPA